jgi:hypothetical protein
VLAKEKVKSTKIIDFFAEEKEVITFVQNNY